MFFIKKARQKMNFVWLFNDLRCFNTNSETSKD